ncbi:MAG: hypothetical protein ACKOPS_23060 [Cyanobium sp.]
MTPLPDRVVLIGLVATIGLCFALVFWTVKLQPGPQQQLHWREAPATAPTPALRPGEQLL